MGDADFIWSLSSTPLSRSAVSQPNDFQILRLGQYGLTWFVVIGDINDQPVMKSRDKKKTMNNYGDIVKYINQLTDRAHENCGAIQLNSIVLCVRTPIKTPLLLEAVKQLSPIADKSLGVIMIADKQAIHEHMSLSNRKGHTESADGSMR